MFEFVQPTQYTLAGRVGRIMSKVQSLAACVTTIPGAQSRYWWKDQLESSTEWLLLIKTSPDRVDSLKRHLSAHHPYDTPELLELPVTSAFTAYAAWVEKETRP